MEHSDGGGGTPRKSLWRSASWSTRSPTSVSGATSKLRPSFNLPPLSVSRYSEVWPRAAAADVPSSSPAASLLVDGDLSRVTDYIYLGGAAAACDHDLLRRRGITHVLNCAGFSCQERFAGEFRYMTLWLRDQPSEDISSLLYDVFDFIEEAHAAFHGRGRALVHCSRGTSRSAALVVAYLMWHQDLSYEDALALVRTARPEADPNPGFAAQLLQWRHPILSPSSSPTMRRRVYRMAPHSAYDPLHLVPKAVDRVGSSELDSRGAFLVHAPAERGGGLYLWVGADCENELAESAAAAARQVLLYERAPGPVVAVGEGAEPADFWDALGCSAAPPLDGCRRKVQTYDLDFEIHRRALKGLPSPATGTGQKLPAGNAGNDLLYGFPRDFSGGSATPSSSETSTIYTSPVSLTSGWHNSSPGSDLSSREAQSPSPLAPPPPLRLPSLVDRIGGADATNIDGGALEAAHVATLYQWDPLSGTVNILHQPGDLDSGSAFFLLVSERVKGALEAKIVFLWIGRSFCSRTDDGIAGNKEEVDCANFEWIGRRFLDQMMLPGDIPLQIIVENEEPEEFLRHRFTFHGVK